MLAAIRLFLSVGLPKVPYLGVPIVAVLVCIDLRSTLAVMKTKIVLIYMTFSLMVFTFFVIRSLFANSGSEDVFFLAALFMKFFLGPFIGFYIARAYTLNILRYFLPVQVVILLGSIFSSGFYDLLLMFQSPAAADLFSGIKDMRGLAFGLLHNEGAVFVAAIFVLQYYKRGRKYGMFDFLAYCFAAMSRLTALFLLIVNVITRPMSIAILIALVFYMTFVWGDSFPPIVSQALEPIVYFRDHGEFFMGSVQHLGWMVIVPDNLATWIIGDGLFFSDNHFYMSTDIGFLRIIFFGGIIAALSYIALNITPMFLLRDCPRSLIGYFFLIFMLANLKGLNPHPWLFFALYFIHRRRSLVRVIPLESSLPEFNRLPQHP